MMDKTLKRILVIGAVIAAIIFFVYNLLFYCDATCGDHRYWAEQQATYEAYLVSTCTPCTDAWKDNLPEGKLVFIIPRTIILGEQNMAFALAYSPENKTANQSVDEYLQDFLYRLNLSEARVNIIETDIVMDTQGHLVLYKVNTPPRSLERKSRYVEPHSVTVGNCLELQSSYFGPVGITVWEMEFIPQEDWSEGQYIFWFYYSYDERRTCSSVCGLFPELENKEYKEVKIILRSQTIE